MTTLLKPVRRETLSSFRGRNILVTLNATWAEVRLKGTRTRYAVTYDQIFRKGAENAARAAREERAARRSARKGRV